MVLYARYGSQRVKEDGRNMVNSFIQARTTSETCTNHDYLQDIIIGCTEIHRAVRRTSVWLGKKAVVFVNLSGA